MNTLLMTVDCRSSPNVPTQDFVALVRTLADSRDTAAFGALMRGPLVGLSDEELLEIAAALPADSEKVDAVPAFSVNGIL
jgi:ATP-dependent exoDNAse (exonuclease V) beta subunit